MDKKCKIVKTLLSITGRGEGTEKRGGREGEGVQDIHFNCCQRAPTNSRLSLAGFAVNLQLLLDHPEATIDQNAPRGHLETSLLENLVTLDQLEPRGDDCTKVYTIYHTPTLLYCRIGRSYNIQHGKLDGLRPK